MSQRNEDIEALSRRIVLFGVSVCRCLPRSRYDLALQHIASQLVRCATSPSGNYAEARAAESKRDFIHKMQICLKEFRETAVWLEYLVELDSGIDRSAIRRECSELTAIFVASIATARRNNRD